jgi:hypothetical protein
MKNILLFIFLMPAFLSCKNKHSPLNEFNNIISKNNRIIVRFDENKYYNEPVVIKVITEPSHISQLKDLIQQSTNSKNCKYYNGTMTFFSDTIKNAFLEFNTNANCPSIYLHLSNGIFEYNMLPYCGMFLQSIKQGEYDK